MGNKSIIEMGVFMHFSMDKAFFVGGINQLQPSVGNRDDRQKIEK
jgi:hypothetical protein